MGRPKKTQEPTSWKSRSLFQKDRVENNATNSQAASPERRTGVKLSGSRVLKQRDVKIPSAKAPSIKTAIRQSATAKLLLQALKFNEDLQRCSWIKKEFLLNAALFVESVKKFADSELNVVPKLVKVLQSKRIKVTLRTPSQPILISKNKMASAKKNAGMKKGRRAKCAATSTTGTTVAQSQMKSDAKQQVAENSCILQKVKIYELLKKDVDSEIPSWNPKLVFKIRAL